MSFARIPFLCPCHQKAQHLKIPLLAKIGIWSFQPPLGLTRWYAIATPVPPQERLVRIFKRRAARVHATGSQAAPGAAAKAAAADASPTLGAPACHGEDGSKAAAALAAQARCRGAHFGMTLAAAEDWARSKRARLWGACEGGCKGEGGPGARAGRVGREEQLGGHETAGLLVQEALPECQASLQDVEWAASVVSTGRSCGGERWQQRLWMRAR